jgi:hypothetical protein
MNMTYSGMQKNKVSSLECQISCSSHWSDPFSEVIRPILDWLPPQYRVLWISHSNILHCPVFTQLSLIRFAANDRARNESKITISKVNDERMSDEDKSVQTATDAVRVHQQILQFTHKHLLDVSSCRWTQCFWQVMPWITDSTAIGVELLHFRSVQVVFESCCEQNMINRWMTEWCDQKTKESV